MKRRELLMGASALALTSRVWAASPSAQAPKLTMPPMLDATTSRRVELRAQTGEVDFLRRGGRARTLGYNGAYLGPTLRLSAGEVAVSVRNQLPFETTAHWHGLLVPGTVDGGPHQPIGPGQSWQPTLPIAQPPATAWYHAHQHGQTAQQVYSGLAGIIHISDGQDDARGLPHNYGVDDLTLVLQDRRFDGQGRMVYDPSMPESMHGFRGDTLLVNGQFGAVASVPKGIVRLRLVNGSNARIYDLTLSDGRPMHLIATDGGYLDQPVALSRLVMAPSERAEVLIDMGDGAAIKLLSGQNPNEAGLDPAAPVGPLYEVLPLVADSRVTARMRRIPTTLGASLPALSEQGATRRTIALEMGMMGGMMRGGQGGMMGGGQGGGMMGRMMGGGGMMGEALRINGQSFDMRRIDFVAKRGTVEAWRVSGAMMMHPFHVHGTRFQVLRENGKPPQAHNRGWKDTVLVDGEVDLLVPFDHLAPKDRPYMLHCHILEHEDGGMMSQFAVL